MQNRTIGIVATIVTVLICGCSSLFTCIWGFLIASGTPIDVTMNGTTTPQTFPPAIGIHIIVPLPADDPGPCSSGVLHPTEQTGSGGRGPSGLILPTK